MDTTLGSFDAIAEISANWKDFEAAARSLEVATVPLVDVLSSMDLTPFAAASEACSAMMSSIDTSAIELAWSAQTNQASSAMMLAEDISKLPLPTNSELACGSLRDSLLIDSPSALPVDQTPPPVEKRKRGRPTILSVELKDRAVAAKDSGATNKQCAQILYKIHYPSREDRSKASTIMRNHRKTQAKRAAASVKLIP